MIPGSKPNDPAFYVLTPYDFPPGYIVTDEVVQTTEESGIKGFYLSMDVEKQGEDGGTMTWLNVGYQVLVPGAGDSNFQEIKEVVPQDFIELEPPVVGDENYFYASPDYTDEYGRYIFFYRKGKFQALVMVESRGIPVNDIISLLELLGEKIN